MAKHKMSEKQRQQALLDLTAPRLAVHKNIIIPVNDITRSASSKMSYLDKLIYGELYTIFNISNKFQLNKKALMLPISNGHGSAMASLHKLQKMHLIRIDSVYEDKSKLIGHVIANAGLNKSALLVDKAFSNTDLQRSKRKHKYSKAVIDMTKKAIGYLNQQAGVHYSPKTVKYQRLIKSCMKNEHATFKDFKRIVDNKVDDWYGTDHAVYLRPSTLFAQGHYDEYLNEHPDSTRVSRVKKAERYSKLANQILEYFNFKMHKDYHNTGNIKVDIYKNLDAGYTVDNFKTVLDHKVRDWEDTKMERWLIPTTIFNPKKFDIYLNEHPKISNDSDMDNDGGDDANNVQW